MSSPVTQITDHAARALAALPSQFRTSAAFRAFCEVWGDEVQLLENWVWSVYAGRLVDSAAGVHLDTIGEKVGAARLGRTDTEYRAIIKVYVAALNSNGGADEIQWIASQLVGETVQYIQEGEARFRLQYLTDEALEPDFLEEALKLIGIAAGGGVAWTLIAGDETDGARHGEAEHGTARMGTVIGGSGNDA